MKILVTGAAGFIGTYVINELIKNYQHNIIATSSDINKARSFEWFPHVQYYEYDINEEHENSFEYFQQPDLMIHLAWQGLPNYKDLFHFEDNLYSNYFFVKNMIKHGLKSLLITGTCFEYGMQNGSLKEDLETMPGNPYAIAKDTLRKFLEQLQEKINFEFKWVRLFYMYGEGQSPISILSQLDRALKNGDSVFNMSGGEQLRDYLPIEKVAEYIVKIAMQDRVSGIINCCSGIPVSIRDLVENYLENKQKKIHLNLGHYPYPDYEPMAFWGDDEKLKTALGYSA
ncbi:MAG: NAD(P)-dependent oxidoreductase [Desulfobacteraceae bacterium]|nr:NAD(P)-dependent oxidoreductase [Desulfobacteraceae bacterium]